MMKLGESGCAICPNLIDSDNEGRNVLREEQTESDWDPTTGG